MDARHKIPNPIISVVAEVFADGNGNGLSTADIENYFKYANAPGDKPGGGKKKMTMAWLDQVNDDESIQKPLDFLGLLLSKFMDEVNKPGWSEGKAKISEILSQHGLQYANGTIISIVGTPSKDLANMLESLDLPTLNNQFERALSDVESNPRGAVSAACNILESLFKEYIASDESLNIPNKQTVHPLWIIVRDKLGFDPGITEDEDLKKIYTGLSSIIAGVGALRTHASESHGPGPDAYELESRHARLAVHAAHTVTYFVLEEWKK